MQREGQEQSRNLIFFEVLGFQDVIAWKPPAFTIHWFSDAVCRRFSFCFACHSARRWTTLLSQHGFRFRGDPPKGDELLRTSSLQASRIYQVSGQGVPINLTRSINFISGVAITHDQSSEFAKRRKSKKDRWSCAGHAQQRSLLTILAHGPITASSAQFCLLCCQPEPLPESLTARMSQPTSRDPCRLPA